MNYDEFSEIIRGEVEKLVRSRIGDAVAVIRTVTKNNNIRMRAISIIRKEETATPTIYIKSYYEEYKRGRKIKDICEEIVQVYESGVRKFKFNFNANDLLNFEKVKDSIFYKLINYDMNARMLEDMPHFRYLDMAIVFYIMVACDEDGQASAIVHNVHLDNWDMTAKQLRDHAFKNTWKTYPAVIKKMEDIVAEMILGKIIEDEEEDEDEDFLKEDFEYGDFNLQDIAYIIREEVEKLKVDRNMQMFVLTNNVRNNGAACLTYPGVLKEFAEEHECDVYIIPSSVHEVILIPGAHWDKSILDKMVVEVNDNELDPVEILSYHTYLFSREDGEIYY